MLTTAPYLRVRRPSPTAAEFTVSTLPPPTLPLRLALAAVHAARLALALAVLLLLCATWSAAYQYPPAAADDLSSFSSSFSSSSDSYSEYNNTAATTAVLATSSSTAAAIAAPPPLANTTTAAAPEINDEDDDDNDVRALSRLVASGLLRAALRSPPGRQCARVAAAAPAWAVVAGSACALWALARRVHVSESLLVLRGLGIQTSSSGAFYSPFDLLPRFPRFSSSSSSSSASSYFGGGGGGGGGWGAGTGTGWGAGAAGHSSSGGGSNSHSRFIPTSKIRDVLVNEAFRGFEVRCYLVVVVDGEDDVVVVFPRLLPRPHIVERVWRGVRECLYEEEEKKQQKGRRVAATRRTRTKTTSIRAAAAAAGADMSVDGWDHQG
ncbi:GPI-GlcNAc transferase complex, PIG-H component-domain-containing protein [Xylariaceae sp. FL0804]|nr:GPI-GlcNAc transferase complex, PIG-H component-domain-containing protein [Xylariaceae sp. FL0804]